jgi:hypothetical protein
MGGFHRCGLIDAECVSHYLILMRTWCTHITGYALRTREDGLSRGFMVDGINDSWLPCHRVRMAFSWLSMSIMYIPHIHVYTITSMGYAWIMRLYHARMDSHGFPLVSWMDCPVWSVDADVGSAVNDMRSGVITFPTLVGVHIYHASYFDSQWLFHLISCSQSKQGFLTFLLV